MVGGGVYARAVARDERHEHEHARGECAGGVLVVWGGAHAQWWVAVLVYVGVVCAAFKLGAGVCGGVDGGDWRGVGGGVGAGYGRVDAAGAPVVCVWDGGAFDATGCFDSGGPGGGDWRPGAGGGVRDVYAGVFGAGDTIWQNETPLLAATGSVCGGV